MDVTYAIVKIYATECSDVIKRQSNVITVVSNRSDIYFFFKSMCRNQKCARKRIYHECEGYIEKSVSPEASLVMPDSDPRYGFSARPSHP